MSIVVERPWVTGGCALVLAALTFVTGLERSPSAFADDKTANPPATKMHTVRFLNEVRPILAQHCFQCHGPDESAQGKASPRSEGECLRKARQQARDCTGKPRWLTRLAADHDR